MRPRGADGPAPAFAPFTRGPRAGPSAAGSAACVRLWSRAILKSRARPDDAADFPRSVRGDGGWHDLRARSLAPPGPADGSPACDVSRVDAAASRGASKVPRVNGRYRAFRARDGRVVPELWVFDLEYFVPSRPPKGAHITIAAGAVRRLTPYREPDAESDESCALERRSGRRLAQGRSRSGSDVGTA